jgi:hypothetical protein
VPFVRYARDRRGYETLYVMHAFEADGRGRPRVIYACRTVPYARVGRAPIDETVQRRIEAAYPALAFDWPRLMKDAAASAPRPERTDARADKRRNKQQQAKPVKQERPARQERPGKQERQVNQEQRVAQEPAVDQEPAVEQEQPVEQEQAIEQAPEPAPAPPALPALPLPSLVVDRAWPVVALVGEERAFIFRGRYLEIANRVLSRIADPGEQRRLLAEAARLNPEGWTTEEQARAGTAGFEAAFEALAAQLRQSPAV